MLLQGISIHKSLLFSYLKQEFHPVKRGHTVISEAVGRLDYRASSHPRPP